MGVSASQVSACLAGFIGHMIFSVPHEGNSLEKPAASLAPVNIA